MAEWKKSPSGKWIPVQAPPIPPRPGAPRLPVPEAPLSGMNAEFIANPLMFLRQHSISPPDNAGARPGREFNRTRVLAGEILSGDLFDGVITRNQAGGVRYVKLVPHTSLDFPGAVGLNVAPEGRQPDTSWIPIHWLPWYSQRIIQHTIAPVPSNLVEPPEEDFPRFFFTAGINGCSVFVTGPSTNPTISHAGITGKLGRAAGQFWRDQMAATGASLGLHKIKSEVNRDDYMFTDPKDSVLATRFMKWKRDSTEPRFDLTVQSSFGCVFGIMYGRHWSFYLQESITINSVHFVKKDAIRAVENTNRTDYYEKGTDLPATLRTTETHRQLGKMALPMTKKVVTYEVMKRSALPMRVSEIYPTRTWSGELQDLYTSMSA